MPSGVHLSRRGFLAATLGLPFLRAQSAAGLAQTPWIQGLDRDQFTLLWITPEPSATAVADLFDASGTRLGSFPSRQTALPENLGFLHEVSLRGLLPNTEYRYRTSACSSPEPTAFRTPSRQSTRALVFGDSGSGSLEQRSLAARMRARPRYDLLLHTGDLIYGDLREETYLRQHVAVYGELLRELPIFPCPGNHDYESDEARVYQAIHPVPLNYGFHWGDDVYVAVLDSNLLTSEALTRFEESLAARQEVRWRIALFHHPPFAGGPNQDDPLSLAVRERVAPILTRQRVQLALSGHEHNYQRTHVLDGVTYLTTGGGGARLYPTAARSEARVQASLHHFVELELNDREIRAHALALDGSLIDSFAIPARIPGTVQSLAASNQQ